MVKKQKSGLLSWFGFGKKQSATETEIDPATEHTEEIPLADEEIAQAEASAQPLDSDDSISSDAQPIPSASLSEHDSALNEMNTASSLSPHDLSLSPPINEDDDTADNTQAATASDVPHTGSNTAQPVETVEKIELEGATEASSETNVSLQANLSSQADAPLAKPADISLEPANAEEAAQEDTATTDSSETPTADTPQPVQLSEREKPKQGFLSKLSSSLRKTRKNLGFGFWSILKGKKIDQDLYDEIEEQLLIADIGIETTAKIIKQLTHKASLNDLQNAEPLYQLLKNEMSSILTDVEQPLVIKEENAPYVILMVGVNGVGKTTTIGKIAKKLQSEGKSVMLAAGDTFRAAAVEQLQVWGERNQIPVVAQGTGADSASVIYDALSAAKARNIDVVIADTAGRLQNKGHLMEELKKIVRVISKFDQFAPHEILLTLDATTGQNAVSQVKLFHDVAPVTGLALTKLDGSAKGGVIFSLADQFKIPLRFIGIGETIDDLRPFEANTFIDALFAHDEQI